jgi:hypothetical protein
MKNDFDDPLPEIPEEALDGLLQAAVWPEADPASIARLERQLKQYSIPHKNRRVPRWTIIAIAITAGLLISATIWAFRSQTAADKPSLANSNAVAQKPATSRVIKTEIASSDPGDKPPRNTIQADTPSENGEIGAISRKKLPIARPPTPYEEVLFRVVFAKRKAAIKAMRKQSAEKTKIIEEPPIPNPPDHASLVRDLMPRANANALVRLVNQEKNPDLQEEILSVLLSRGDPQSVGAYLDFVLQRAYAQRALSALDRLEEPPVEAIFGFLCGGHTSRRLAAALALGRIDGPETSRKLYEMVCGNVSRQEAMVALLASSGDDASRYVALAKQNISLVGVLNGAQYQYRSLSITQ